jgi:hypothetical protein
MSWQRCGTGAVTRFLLQGLHLELFAFRLSITSVSADQLASGNSWVNGIVQSSSMS